MLLDQGGYPIYFGNPVESLIYFKQKAHFADTGESQCPQCGNVNPEQLFNIIEARLVDEYGDITEIRKVTPSEWNEQFNQPILEQVKPKEGKSISGNGHGVFQGIITLNDILEALVGDAADFYEDEFKIVAKEDGSWLVDGHYSLHDFLTYFDMDELIGDYDVTTVSGLIITELGVIPKQGQKLIWNKLEFEAQKMDGVKIDKVLITTLKDL